MVEPIRRPVHSRLPSFGARFLLYQRNSENLSSQAGLASGVNNAVAWVAGLLWIAASPPITGLTGAASPRASASRFRVPYRCLRYEHRAAVRFVRQDPG
jgi:hypothetical protein